MGVQGLWSLVGPAARPTQLESLRQKKIAVDASIWIHQFMRTMRDKEGNALRNGHLLGFFRRICKLLFFNIKPVFVFDGGAPSLKRTTIRERRKRREGVKLNLRATARKILSAQVKSRVLMQEEKKLRGETDTAEEPNENFVYVDELEKTAEVLRKVHKTDQYELPEMPAGETMNKLDPRLATREEIQSFVDEFAPTDLDIDSSTFQALPPEMQYEVIQDLKNKSRQTSHARLEEMVKGSATALDFSKHQIRLLKHRNNMTQKLMQMNTMAGGNTNIEPARIAGERGRQYILYKNENIDEGLGWKLPGLSAAEPVALDAPDRAEPVIATPMDGESAEPEVKEEQVDKVAAAMKSNPALAALFADVLSDDDEEEDQDEFEEIGDSVAPITHEMDTTDESPLFVNNAQGQDSFEEPHLMNDMRAYMHDGDDDEAMQQVINRIYQSDAKANLEANPPSTEIEEDAVLSLNAEDFLNLWISRMPDAFLYLHSFNDEHRRILKKAVYETKPTKLERELKSVRKQFGKTNERDELALEALQFHESFLESVVVWKEKHQDKSQLDSFGEIIPNRDASPIKETAAVQKIGSPLILNNDSGEDDVQFMDAPIKTNKEDLLVLDDDDDDTDIQFKDLSTITKEVDQSPEKEEIGGSQDHVRININQSLLQKINDTSMKKAIGKEDPNESGTTVQERFTEVGNMDDQTSKHQAAESIDIPISKEQQEQDDVKEVESRDDPTTVKEIKEMRRNDNDIGDKDAPVTTAEIMESTEHNEQGESILAEDRGYNSEDELDTNVNGEEDEYARFVSNIASKKLDEVRTELYQDMKELNKQQRKEMGNSDDITDQMIQDIQELLKLFGVPYIVSPMEAEAQCAELEALKLIDGTITDDSDVFLFGASRVYKNMFNQQRYVECYLSSDIEREMLLNRRKLIQLAFLLGSDYTDGIPGVGPVAAMEILSEFSKKKEVEEEENEEDEDEEDEEEEPLEAPLKRFKGWYNCGIDETAFQRKFRKKFKDMDIPDDFPNPLVKEAYYSPTVDKSTQKFEWGAPQLDSLRIFLQEAFGWSEEKADQVLLPVIREMNSKKTSGEQQVLGSFFNVTDRVSSSSNTSQHKHSSKRVQNIVDQWRKQKKPRTKK